MKKSIVAIAIVSSLFASHAFAANEELKAANAAKSAQLKSIRLDIKKVKEAVQVVKLTEKSKKLDDQLAAAKLKLEEMNKTVATNSTK